MMFKEAKRILILTSINSALTWFLFSLLLEGLAEEDWKIKRELLLQKRV